MPSRSRRALLRAVGAVAAGLAGCGTTSDPTATGPPTATPTPSRTATPSPTDPPTDSSTAPPPALRCGPGAHPDAAWPQPQRGPTHDSFVADATTFPEAPSVSWSVEPTVPDDVDERDAGFGQPLVVGDRVYVVRRVQFGPEVEDPGGHALQCRDRSTGELLWSRELPERPPAPAVHGDLVLVASGDTVYAHDRHDGSARWTRTVDDRYGRVVPAADRIYVRGDDLHALAPDGTTAWDRTFGENVAEPPAVGPDGVYAGLVGGEVVALDPSDGETAWTARTPRGPDESGALSPNLSTVVATDCGTFVVTDGDVHAFDPDGELVWHAEGYVGRLATDGRTLYGRDREPDPFRTFLRARDAATGELRWERQLEVASGAHGVLTGDALYVPTADGLRAVDPDDGRELWTAAPILGSLALADGVIYGTDGGSLVAME